MDRGLTASTIMASGFLCPHYGISAMESHPRRPMFSDDEAKPQHAARSGESSSPDPVLNIVIKCTEKAQ